MENLYHVLMDGIQDMVFVMKVENGDVFRHEFINQAAMDGTGLTTEVIGKTLKEVYPNIEGNYIHRQYQSVLNIKNTVIYEDRYTSCNKNISSNKKVLYSETTLTPLFNETNDCTHIVAIVKDITERKKTKLHKEKTLKKLYENEKRFRIIAENSYDVIVLINNKKEINYISPSCQRVLGYSYKHYIDTSIVEHVHPEDREMIVGACQQAIAYQKSCRIQFRQIHYRKGWIWSELRGTPVYDENGNLMHMVATIMDITLQKNYEAKMNFFAFHDSLTGLPNRRYLNKRLTVELKNEQPLAVIMMDIDHFKSINDELGHDIGDQVIEEFASRVTKTIRKDDFIARLGGDEFVLLLPNTTLEEAKIIIKNIQQEMKKDWHIDGHTIQVTASLGITVESTNQARKSNVLRSADIALYEAKKRQRGSSVIKETD